MDSIELRSTIGRLLAAQKLAVLASYGTEQPYASLVAFAASADLRSIYFATPRATRKFANLSECPRVSLLIDNRSNRQLDFDAGVAATALGRAVETAADEGDALELYLLKHPHLKEFIAKPSTALFRVRVERYYLVSKFQEVVELPISETP